MQRKQLRTDAAGAARDGALIVKFAVRFEACQVGASSWSSSPSCEPSATAPDRVAPSMSSRSAHAQFARRSFLVRPTEAGPATFRDRPLRRRLQLSW